MSHWITDPAVLRQYLTQRPARIGLDTEFIRERTWWPQLALVQIALESASHDTAKDDSGVASADSNQAILLLDPLSPGICEALAPLLTDPAVLKVMHSASEDLIALKRACGVVPQPLFDTQVAAALAGVGAGMGYQRLVQEQLGIALGKGETRSDWLRRPLSASQLDYAADDVRHLFALNDLLGTRLDLLGRRGWLVEDCARQIANAQDDDLERWPHLALRPTQFLDVGAQRRLLRLLRWRDLYARDNDRPRGWILDNDLAVALARDPPIDPAALQRQLDAHPKAPRKLGAALWQALSRPLPDEEEAPAPRSDERDKQALRRLQDAVAARSSELGLPDGVLASKRWLQHLLDRHVDGRGEAWPGPLAGWRRELLEPRLAPLLDATST